MAFQDMGMGSKFFGHQFLKMPIFFNLRTIGYQRWFSQANYEIKKRKKSQKIDNSLTPTNIDHPLLAHFSLRPITISFA